MIALPIPAPDIVNALQHLIRKQERNAVSILCPHILTAGGRDFHWQSSAIGLIFLKFAMCSPNGKVLSIAFRSRWCKDLNQSSFKGHSRCFPIFHGWVTSKESRVRSRLTSYQHSLPWNGMAERRPWAVDARTLEDWPTEWGATWCSRRPYGIHVATYCHIWRSIQLHF